jgi:LmbE family N-acetylglucosaminyl deacetylase
MNALLHDLITPDKIVRARIAIVVAHPDDEIIGAGGQLHRWPNVHFIHVTNGSPANLDDARAAGCRTGEKYTQLRRDEFNRVLRYLNLPRERAANLGFGDQEAAFHLTEIADVLRNIFRDLSPDIVLTHPFEGGHPDHDATAFAVHNACDSRWPIVEMAGYHNAHGCFRAGEFLPEFATDEIRRDLLPFERLQKEALFRYYSSQSGTLALFGATHERFRIAPEYDFCRAPHTGQLYYERFPWNMTADLWSELARRARGSMGRTGAPPVAATASVAALCG